MAIGIVTHVSFEFRGGYDISRAASGCVGSGDVVGSCGEVIITSHADSCKRLNTMISGIQSRSLERSNLQPLTTCPRVTVTEADLQASSSQQFCWLLLLQSAFKYLSWHTRTVELVVTAARAKVRATMISLFMMMIVKYLASKLFPTLLLNVHHILVTMAACLCD